MLYPQSNAKRDVYNFNGIWSFATVEDGYIPSTPLKSKQPMPVPASYNDIVVEKKLRDYVGQVVYERECSFPVAEGKKYRLRIGATSHRCRVFWNGEEIGGGNSGFYPIDLPIEAVREKNRLSVLIDNRLTFQTLPPGDVKNGKQVINFDFYNFTGIHRDVLVYGVPETSIEDIVVQTVVDGDYHKVKASITPAQKATYTLFDADGKQAACSNDGELFVESPVLWALKKGYLYTLRVETESDCYEERFGIRKVTYDEKGLYLNDKRVYLKGFGKHEDFYLSGKGNNSAVNVRDFELLKWIGANSIRTSHYPYCEEIINLADEYGIMVIDEVPAVGMNWFRGGEKNFLPHRLNDETKKLHKALIKALIERDKNHPCVVMLSVANEPASEEEESRPYFEEVIAYARTLSTLPITLPEVTKIDMVSQVGDLVDFISLNRYYGWYEEHGDLTNTQALLIDECTQWYERYRKPMFIAEFGADTIEGYHTLPSDAFSEDYQCEYLAENFQAFDKMPFMMGEHVWNFADFKTKQGTIRVRGNRKGVFTRERQPKAAAHLIKKRWEEKPDYED